MNLKNNIISISTTSIVEKILLDKTNMREKELQKLKFDSLKNSVFVGLFFWLTIGIIAKDIYLSAGISILVTILLFILLIQLPLAKKKKYSNKIEAQLPLFLMRLASEIKLGKSFQKAIIDCCNEENEISNEFRMVLLDMNKGLSFQEALEKMNLRIDSQNIKRTCSNLSNLQIQGTKDVSGIKKLAEELLIKQRIQSKEFSGKMVVYALMFIAMSAIVPAMFESFILIGSYFMKLSFDAQEIFLISVLLFPLLDLIILITIDQKTPLFLK